MIATDTDGMPMRLFPSRIFYEVDRQSQRKLRRIDVGIPGNYLFQNVSLRSSPQLLLRDPVLQSNSGIQAEQDRCRRVDCHASADFAKVDSIEQPSHIVDTANSDSPLAPSPFPSPMITVTT